MRIEFMQKHCEEFGLGKMAKILSIGRSSYYEFISRPPSKRTLRNEYLVGRIKEIYQESRRTYGSPRVHAKLKTLGESCSRRRVAKLMQKEHLQAKMRKKWKITTQPGKNTKTIVPNYLDQKFTVEAPNTVWGSDITYVFTKEGWLYVSVVLDLFSRKVIGLSMSNSLQTAIIVKSLKQALYNRNPKVEVMHHSDRGCQYTSEEFRVLTKEKNIKLSMSAKGRCYDNAVLESFFHTLKTEHVHLCQFRTREEAINSIFEYVEVFYNRKRIHSTLGYLSPLDFENHWMERNQKKMCS